MILFFKTKGLILRTIKIQTMFLIFPRPQVGVAFLLIALVIAIILCCTGSSSDTSQSQEADSYDTYDTLSELPPSGSFQNNRNRGQLSSYGSSVRGSTTNDARGSRMTSSTSRRITQQEQEDPAQQFFGGGPIGAGSSGGTVCAPTEG